MESWEAVVKRSSMRSLKFTQDDTMMFPRQTNPQSVSLWACRGVGRNLLCARFNT